MQVNLIEGQFQELRQVGHGKHCPLSGHTGSAEKAKGERNVPGSLPLCSQGLFLLSRQRSTSDKNPNNSEHTSVAGELDARV